VVEMHQVKADLNDLTPVPVVPTTIDEIDDEGDDSVEEEDGVKNSDDNKAKESDTGNSKDNEDGYEDMVSVFSSPRRKYPVLFLTRPLSITTTLRQTNLRLFLRLPHLAQALSRNPRLLTLVCLLFCYTPTRRPSSNPLPKENARPMHSQEGERRRPRPIELISER
jgi:hypothetical protein